MSPDHGQSIGQFENSVLDIVADIEASYVDRVAQSIYESLLNPPLPGVKLPSNFVPWSSLGPTVQGYYSNAAISAIRALLAVYFGEHEALAKKVGGYHGNG